MSGVKKPNLSWGPTRAIQGGFSNTAAVVVLRNTAEIERITGV